MTIVVVCEKNDCFKKKKMGDKKKGKQKKKNIITEKRGK